MEIIGHTSSLNKTKGALQHFLISHSCDKLEMDFVFTRDSELVWTHSPVYNGKLVNRSNYQDVKSLLTLEDVLESLNGDVGLLLEIKYFKDNPHNLEKLIRKLELVLSYPNYIAISSFNADLVRKLLKHKKDLNNKDIGLIINLFKTLIYRKGNIQGLKDVDLISLSSELWETGVFKEDYKTYRELFPNALEYAWTWETLYHEDTKRITNYIDKDADGIITSNPNLVRCLIK